MASHSAHAGVGIDWDARYVAGDTPWDKGAAHPALQARLKKLPIAGRVLVPGCGAGHDVRALAAGGAAFVLGLDVAPSALNLAQSYPKAGKKMTVSTILQFSKITIFHWETSDTVGTSLNRN
jgi:2-polyprenyl-3-methyl-5-hydroxy-6-metoxy-1,4-benzoquinol methylase